MYMNIKSRLSTEKRQLWGKKSNSFEVLLFKCNFTFHSIAHREDKTCFINIVLNSAFKVRVVDLPEKRYEPQSRVYERISIWNYFSAEVLKSPKNSLHFGVELKSSWMNSETKTKAAHSRSKAATNNCCSSNMMKN